MREIHNYIPITRKNVYLNLFLGVLITFTQNGIQHLSMYYKIQTPKFFIKNYQNELHYLIAKRFFRLDLTNNF